MRLGITLWLPLLAVFSTFLGLANAFPKLHNSLGLHNRWLAQMVFRIDQSSDIYDIMRKGVPALQRYANDLLRDTASYGKEIASRVDEVKTLVIQASDEVTELHKQLENALHSKRSDELTGDAHVLVDILHEIELAFQRILDELRTSFPPPDQAPSHDEREALVARLLQKAEDALIDVLCVKHHIIEEERFRNIWAKLRPAVQKIVVTTGDLAEQHPELAEFILIAGTFMVIPESWFFRPLLRLFGFGPYGPVKGSPAAWVQRVFYGAEVPVGSWFSHMQRAGMKYGSSVFRKIVMSLGAAAGIVGSLRLC